MAGFGRTGKMFAWQNFDMKPDIISFAKGVTCGYVPLGGVIVSKAISDYFTDHVLQCGLTYSGHTLACAAGVASVNYYIEHDVCAHVKQMEGILKPFLEEMERKHICVGESRCLGLFAAMTIVKNKETRELMSPYHTASPVMGKIMGALKDKGFLTFGRETNVNICPPLTITAEELTAELPKLDEVLTWVDENFCD
jgi:taurine--2-oxoglutarate transaminase